MIKKYSSTIAGASLIIISFGLISKGLGFVREIVFAGSFGLSKDFDIYLAGSVIPIIIDTAIIYLGQNFFIPSYNKLKAQNSDTSDFFNTFLWIFILGGVLLTGLLYIFSNNIIGLYLINSPVQTQQIASSIFKLFILTVPVNSAIAIIIAFLQAEFEFKYPAISQLWVNISIIILTVFLAGKLNVYVIPIGFVTGMLLQLFYLLPKVKKYTRYKIPHLSNVKNLISVTFSTLMLTIFIETVSQFYMLADRFFIRSVDTGGIAALNYAQNLFLLPVSIFSIALSTAIFPKLSQKYHSDNPEELNKSLIAGLNINAFISLPLMILFSVFGIYLISLFYQNGNFNYQDSITTFNVLRILSISLMFYAIYSILNKLIYGIGAIKFLAILTVTGIALKFVLNFIFVETLKQDGLALSTSITYFYFFTVGIIYTKVKLKNLALNIFLKDLILTLFNCIATFILIKILWNSFGIEGLPGAVILIIIFLTVYLINSVLLEQKSFNILKTAYFNYVNRS